jgi:hypothetical protein
MKTIIYPNFNDSTDIIYPNFNDSTDIIYPNFNDSTDIISSVKEISSGKKMIETD